MKLNYDCIRDIMLTIEEQETPMDMTSEEFCQLLPKFSELELLALRIGRALKKRDIIHLSSYY